jgi:hypothetical protein
MTDIYIRANTTTDDIRRQLSEFGWLSKVEASIEEPNRDERIIVLHEVTFGQRLGRLFQSVEKREKSVEISRRAMRELADTRSVFGTLIGSSINNKSDWTAIEIHRALASQLERLVIAERGTGLMVPLKENGQIGVANAKVMDIKSDSKICWKLRPETESRPTTVSNRSESRPHVEVTVSHPVTPTDEQMRSAYKNALTAASGHVVIAPIKHFHEGVEQPCSNRSILLLLEAIDNAKQTNPNLTAVTIAAGEYGDADLAGRIEDLQAARRQETEEIPMKSQRGRFYPPHGRQAPGIAGIHFLTNSPFELQAGKTIVPLSLAQSKGYAYVNELDVSDLPKLDEGRLIAFDDGLIDQVKGGSPKDFGERFSQLLQNMAGTVVIYPPPLANKEQLQAMMSAVMDAREKNRSLSVSFATEDVNQREALTNAFVAAKQARQDALELDIGADPEEEIIVFADLWKKA